MTLFVVKKRIFYTVISSFNIFEYASWFIGKNIPSDELKVLHKHITAEHGSHIANQAVVLVRTLINYAIKEGKYKNFNPAIAVKLNKKEARARYGNFIYLQ